MSGYPPVLFVVGQPAAAVYLAPLWRRWLRADEAPQWRIMVHPCALDTLASLGFGVLPELAVDREPRHTPWPASWRPASVLVSASGKDEERQVLDAARRARIPARLFLDTSYDYARRVGLSGGDLPDEILVISETAREEAIEQGLPSAKLRVVGQPGWESISEVPPADPGVVLFASQPVSQVAGLEARLGYSELTAMALVRRAADRRPDLFRRLLWAPHPRESVPSAPFPDVEYVRSAKEVLGQAGTVIGMYSSFLTEAALAGRKVISVQPGAVGPDLCDLSRHGMIRRTQTVDELVAAMEDPLNRIDKLRSDLSGSCRRLEMVLTCEVPQ